MAKCTSYGRDGKMLKVVIPYILGMCKPCTISVKRKDDNEIKKTR